jgi:hypothetical protein
MAQQQKIGVTQQFCIVKVKGVIAVVVLMIIVIERNDVFILPFVQTIQCKEIADNKFAHDPVPFDVRWLQEL